MLDIGIHCIPRSDAAKKRRLISIYNVWLQSVLLQLKMDLFCLFDLTLYVPVNIFSVMSGWVVLGLTRTAQWYMCFAKGHNTVTPVRLEPAAPLFRVKYSTTEPLCSQNRKWTGPIDNRGNSIRLKWVNKSEWVWSSNITISNCLWLSLVSINKVLYILVSYTMRKVLMCDAIAYFMGSVQCTEAGN